MKFEVGDTVYFQEHWSKNLVEGTITKLFPSDFSTEGIRCNNCYFVNQDGVRIGKMVGEVGAFAGEYFSSVERLLEYIKQRDRARVNKMKDSIKNLNDLLAFPLDHCFCGEEYTDYDAIKAYKERVFELTGTDLDKEEPDQGEER